MLLNTQDIYFASDLHIGHANVIKHDNRPFENVHDMNDALLHNWNSKISENSTVFYLGDMFYKCSASVQKWFTSNLNGKIYFIMGNHDRYREIRSLNRFERIFGDDSGLGGCTISVLDKDANKGKQEIVMCHYPILSWNKGHYGSWHLYGHCHQSLARNKDLDFFNSRKVLDMGCNGWDYTPVSYQEVKEIMSKKEIKSVDHHGKN